MPEVTAQTYQELGEFIGSQSPYGRAFALPEFLANDDIFEEQDPTIPQEFAVKLGVLRAGPLRTADAQHPRTTEVGDETLEWKVNGQPYRITKAIRIHYHFKRTVVENGQPVEKDVGAFLLIGYNGDGH